MALLAARETQVSPHRVRRRGFPSRRLRMRRCWVRQEPRRKALRPILRKEVLWIRHLLLLEVVLRRERKSISRFSR